MSSSQYTTTALIPFQFHGRDITTIRDANGEPWWKAAEVCEQCGIKNVSKACERLDTDEKAVITLSDSAGRPQEMLIVNEAGLYALTLSSRKPEAKEFKRWVTHDVIPQIRKTGSYGAPAALTPAQMFLAQARAMVAMEERQERIEAKVDALIDRRPPEGKQRIEDWLRREAKPYLNKDLMRLLRGACNERERPAEFRPEGMDWPLRYYSPATIADAYDAVTRQLGFFCHDPGVPYKRTRRVTA